MAMATTTLSLSTSPFSGKGTTTTITNGNKLSSSSCSSLGCSLPSPCMLFGHKLKLKGARRGPKGRRCRSPNAAWFHEPPSEDVADLATWLFQQGFPDQILELKNIDGRIGCFARRDLQVGEIALKIPEKYTVTCVDVVNHPVISKFAAGRPDLIGLTLLVMYEKWRGQKSPYYPFLKTFPSSTLSPLTWSATEQETLLKGTSAAEEIKLRVAALEDEYNDMNEIFSNEFQELPSDAFNVEAFKRAFSVVLARTIYLPTAELFALVPFADAVNLEGQCQAIFDYSTEEQEVILRVDRSYKSGDEVFVSYGQNRPNSDLLISYGMVDENNADDYLELEVGLVDGDPLKSLKMRILQQANFENPQTFPLYVDRFPTQLLSYTRLARLQDSAAIAKITFEKDIIIDQGNEYETLTLLLSECRDRLSSFDGSVDDDKRFLQGRFSPKESLAAKFRISEKNILSYTMAALRQRLAPIRGVPSKGGSMKDPNSDIKEIFDMMEQVASAPGKLLDKFRNK